MQNFQYTFETRKRSSISALSICVTVLLKGKQLFSKIGKDHSENVCIFLLRHYY